MSALAIPWMAAAACGLGLAGFAAGLFSLFLADRTARIVRRRAEEHRVQTQDAVAAVRRELDSMAGRMKQIQEQAPAPAGAAAMAPGFNLSKRSQVLRMNRRGDPPEQIATALGLPRQEVDLVLKVHRIVLDSV